MVRNIHYSGLKPMAKLSDLVAALAESTETPETTVKEVARKLREGQLIRTGKGGRYGGAQMTHDDVAALIVGLMAYRTSDSALPKLAPLTRELLRGTSYKSDREWRPGVWPRELNLPLLAKLKPGHSFKDAVVALILSVNRGDTEDIDSAEPVLQVVCASARPFAVISFESGKKGPSITHIELSYTSARSGFPIHTPRLSVTAQLMLATIKEIGGVIGSSSHAA